MLTINSVNVTVTCPFCGSESHMVLDYRSFESWMNGELVQNAFPYLDANERERITSGICPECWDRMFPSDDPEEDWEDEWPIEDEEDNDSEWEEREDFPDDHLWDSYDLDFGFNPYMGCYDYDC